MTQKVEQPKLEYQELYDSLVNATDDIIEVRGKKVRIGWMRNETMDKFTSISIREKNEFKRNTKLAACVLLNNLFKLKLFYWIYWRYLYYVVQIDQVDVLKILDTAKKKIPQDAFYMNTILATGMSKAMMTMTRKEANLIQAGLTGEQRTL